MGFYFRHLNIRPEHKISYIDTDSTQIEVTIVYGRKKVKEKGKLYMDENMRKEPAECQPEKKPLGIQFGKLVTLVLTFGIIMSVTFTGTYHFWGSITEDTKEETKEQDAARTLTKAGKTETNSGYLNMSENGAVMDVSGVVQNVMPAVVAITNMSEVTYESWFGQSMNYEEESAGSGIIIAQDEEYIYIATNNHVVANSSGLTVQFHDNSTAMAEIKGTEPGNDLAVIAVQLKDIDKDTFDRIRIATIGDSTGLKVGEAAIAIGNALGYGQSVTTGVISALDREVSVEDETSGMVMSNRLIQTDAAINPGNSGGALLNMKGEVIGINSVKYSDTSVEGMGYAIPMHTAERIVEKLINRELADEEEMAYLGVKGVDVSGSVSDTYNMPEGVYVYMVVSGSPAEEAGIMVGDIITEFDGSKVTSKQNMEEQLLYYKAGTTVSIMVQRLSNENHGEYVQQEITVRLVRRTRN